MATDELEASIDVSQSLGLKRILKNKVNPALFTKVKAMVQSGQYNIHDIEDIVNQCIEEADTSVKKTVYDNYQLFIEAAKEVSLLETEMHFMNGLLKEQKNLLETLIETSISQSFSVNATQDAATLKRDSLTRASADSVQDSRKALSFVLETVEGSSDVADVPDRVLLFHGECTELEPSSFSPLREMYLFLLNDCVLFTSLTSSSKYLLQQIVELDSISFTLVNSESDLDNHVAAAATAAHKNHLGNLLKLRIFPETRFFRVQTEQVHSWLSHVKQAKLSRALAGALRRETTLTREIATATSDKEKTIREFEDVPDDIDVLIAERKFDKVVDKIQESYVYMQQYPELKHMKSRIDLRKHSVIELLLKELRIPPHVSLRGGPTSSRRAVLQLIRLGKSFEAATSYLALRSSISLFLLDQVKQEESQALYAKRISTTFFKHFVETLREFNRANFTKDSRSLLLKWSRSEVKTLVDFLESVLGSSSVSFADYASGWQAAKNNAKKVSEKEQVQVLFMLESLCITSWQETIEAQSKKLIAAADSRAAEEKWNVLKRSTRKEIDEFANFVNQFMTKAAQKSLTESTQVSISSMTYVFSNSYLKFADGVVRLYCSELHQCVSDVLAATLSSEIKHYRRCLTAAQLLPKRDFILHNLNFLSTYILQTINQKLKQASGFEPESFQSYQNAQTELTSLIQLSTPNYV